jgi:hypothetical protein
MAMLLSYMASYALTSGYHANNYVNVQDIDRIRTERFLIRASKLGHLKDY